MYVYKTLAVTRDLACGKLKKYSLCNDNVAFLKSERFLKSAQ